MKFLTKRNIILFVLILIMIYLIVKGLSYGYSKYDYFINAFILIFILFKDNHKLLDIKK
jgi:hypothetical protein